MKFSERQINKTDVVPKEAPTWAQTALGRLVDAHNQSQTELKQALGGGLGTVENTVADLKTIRVAMPAPPFKDFTLIAPWLADTARSRPTPGYIIMPGGLVRLRGAVSTGTPAYGASGEFATLPFGAYPDGLLTFAVDGGDYGHGLLEVDTDGKLRCVYSMAAVVRCDLSPVSFLAAPAAQPHAFVGSGWPLIVNHGFARCRQAEIVDFSDKDRVAGAAQGAPVLDWRDRGDGSLAIDGIWGLQWNRAYDVRLRLSPE